MYGTIAQFKVAPGQLDQLRETFGRIAAEPIPGHVSTVIYQSDKDPDTVYLVATFEDSERYWENARSPEQARRYESIRSHLAEDPIWNDGEVIVNFRAGAR